MFASTHWRHGPGPAWNHALADGWRRLRTRAHGAWTGLTRALADAGAPAASRADPAPPFPAPAWGILATEVFEDERRVLVRLAAPGMRKDDFRIDLRDGLLFVRGEPADGQASGGVEWHAGGRFSQTVALSGPVLADQARASYRDGVLEIELPRPPRPGQRRIEVSTA